MPVFNVCRYISLFIILIFYARKYEATERNCSSFFDCGGRPCCRVSNYPLIKVCSDTHSCVGKACLHAYHCGGDHFSMCCKNNICTNDIERCSCTSVYDPICRHNNKYCCKQQLTYRIRTCKQYCENHPCTNDKECAKDECCDKNNVCSTRCKYMHKCTTDSDCTHTLKCCNFRPSYKKEWMKVCMYTCNKRCMTSDDCPDQCCGSDQLCKDCNDSVNSSWTTFIIITCVIMFTIICAAIVLTYYCRRRGRCVLFKRRVNEEVFELCNGSENRSRVQNNRRSDQNSPLDQNSLLHQNRPPPPYSFEDEPFPATQNNEFPPLYMPLET